MSEKSQATVSVLLVEDNEIDIEVTKRVLARSGANVSLRVARDGEEALQLLFRARTPGVLADAVDLPRLVLLDLRLPGIDGQGILRRIKNHPDLCAIPVAVLTGSSGERSMLECMALGGNMYFVKPMTPADAASLLPAVQKYWDIMASLRGGDAGATDEAA